MVWLYDVLCRYPIGIYQTLTMCQVLYLVLRTKQWARQTWLPLSRSLAWGMVGGAEQGTRHWWLSCECVVWVAGRVLGAHGRSTISKMPTISCSTQTPISENSRPNRHTWQNLLPSAPPPHSLSDQGWTCNPQGPIRVLAGDLQRGSLPEMWIRDAEGSCYVHTAEVTREQRGSVLGDREEKGADWQGHMVGSQGEGWGLPYLLTRHLDSDPHNPQTKESQSHRPLSQAWARSGIGQERLPGMWGWGRLGYSGGEKEGISWRKGFVTVWVRPAGDMGHTAILATAWVRQEKFNRNLK